MSFGLVMALALTASGGCPPSLPEEPPPVSQNPDWLVKPTAQDIYWAYPPRAVAVRVEGRATVECRVSIQGAAYACTATAEDPKDYGFGAAAVAVMSKALFKPAVRCGRVTEGQIRVPISFRLPQRPDEAATEPLDPKDTRLAAAARLVAALHLMDTFAENIDSTGWALTQMIDEKRGGTPEERQVVHDAARQTWANWSDKVLNAAARSLAARLSEEELTLAAEFYESPAGAKLTLINRDLVSDVGEAFEEIEPDMILEFHRRYCEKMPEKCAPPDAL